MPTPVNRRLALLADPEEFAALYVEAFVARFTKIQLEYRKRKRAFDTLFKHRPRDEARQLRLSLGVRAGPPAAGNAAKFGQSDRKPYRALSHEVILTTQHDPDHEVILSETEGSRKRRYIFRFAQNDGAVSKNSRIIAGFPS